jgi:hypothetical protein
MGYRMGLKIPGDWFTNPKVLEEFYKQYRNYPVEEIRRVSFEQGLAFGRSMKVQLGLEGDDVETLATVLRAVLRDEPTAKVMSVEGGRVHLRNSGFCPLMTVSLSMNLPWTWLCNGLGWPFFHGIASAVNPKMNLTMTKRREKGDPYCDHIFEVGEGKLIIPEDCAGRA